MKLLLKNYIASLRESGELDVLLPDLLSQMGLNIISTPQKGTRQEGVDVAAYGKLPNEKYEKLYLISIKDGDLDRKHWNSGNPQDVLPSINDICVNYINQLLPNQYKKSPREIIICCGGDLKQNVQSSWHAVQLHYNKEKFSLWNGDKIAEWVEHYMLNETILNSENRKLLRKILVLVDQPKDSLAFYTQLLSNIITFEGKKPNLKNKIKAINTVNLLLNIIFVWAREEDNLELPYIAGERSVLYLWDLVVKHDFNKGKNPTKIYTAYLSIIETWTSISSTYLDKMADYCISLHGLSSTSRDGVDSSLFSFELCGKIASIGMLFDWFWRNTQSNAFKDLRDFSAKVLISLVNNNPASHVPLYDNHIIDIMLSISLLSKVNVPEFQNTWMINLINKSIWGYRRGQYFPISNYSYEDLLLSCNGYSEKPKEDLTRATTLYPILAVWAAQNKNLELYKLIKYHLSENLPHSTPQIWFADNETEKVLYKNQKHGGATFVNTTLEDEPIKYLEKIVKAQKRMLSQKSSATQRGFEFIAWISSRHYKRPLLPELWLDCKEL